ncbi:Developmental regulator flbA [Hyphodiscus hymeniophilus]|uniref:Developmental regulator flbA n=1 Tax=Hyphodiscus hymeniophilus TaxID=353542 RepID=A0A9P7AXL8_9HELO|nr:Developmental regulator flbA [Hyphodiscus hymeniophilus]
MAVTQSSPSTSSTTTTSDPIPHSSNISATLVAVSDQHLHHTHHHASTASTASTRISPGREASTGHNAPALPDTATLESSLTNTLNRPSINHKHRQSTQSTILSRQNRTALLTLAALAKDKATNAIASFSEPSIRSRHSSSSLYRSAQSSRTSSPNNSHTLPGSANSGRATDQRQDSSATFLSPSTASRSDPTYSASPLSQRQSLLQTYPPSQAYTDTAADTPPPIAFVPRRKSKKMHQTSSRLLRMTSDDRPFTRDFKDLFATLVVSLPLAPHRVRLSRVDHSFLSEEAINNLGSLKFSQSNRMPDPKDPSRIVTTTTTTTFSMAREMARSVCQRFLDARFIESADGKQAKEFTMKGTVWQLTPKGIHVLERFCSKNGIQQKHVTEVVNSPRNTMQLVILERDSATDKLSSDRSTIEVIFRRFVGQNGPNIKNSTSSADSDSLSEYKDGIAGVRMASERKVGSPPRTVYQTFTGKATTDWLMDCCTTVDKRETTEVASLFLEQELIWEMKFQPTKHAIYQLTQKGKDVINMTSRERTSESEGASSVSGVPRAGVSRDSNTQKLDKILNDAALRLLFRENLRDTHCEENLSFYLDVDEFLKSCRAAIKSNAPRTKSNSSTAGLNSLDSVKETMASAYGIYNAFLAPGSPCELNIDHLLRNQLATRMTKAVGQDAAMIESLKEVTALFEEAQTSVFKLMASDSVPKFMKSAKYEQTLKNYDFDSISPRYNANGPERSMSRSAAGSSRGH